jgi:hypothetical protein
MLKLSKIYIFWKRREKNIGILNVISRLVERKKNLEKIEDIYHGGELVIRKEVKYLLLKMSTFYLKYFLTLMKFLEIWYA